MQTGRSPARAGAPRPQPSALPDRASARPPRPPETDDLSRRLHALVSSALRQGPPRAPTDGGDGEVVLLDLEVDGVRCVLTRPERRRSPRPTVRLSPRERDIARMVAQGYPNKAIAAVLDISAWTVSTHLRRVFARLGVSSRAAMVATLIEDGLMDGPHAAGVPPR